MKKHGNSTKTSHAFRRPGWIVSAVTLVALVVGASAQTLIPVHRAMRLQPAGVTYPAGPSGPNDDVLFNVLHIYAPSEICAAYGVDVLHNEGWTGKGQTIVIVDSYGSPTALQDLQTFSTYYGLAAPDLTIIYPDGMPAYSPAMQGIELDWAEETSLDLQWAHVIAPDAKLVLIAANPAETEGVQGFPSMFRGIQYAIQNYPGSPISQSFAATEQTFESAAAVQLQQYEAVYQQAIAAGWSPLAGAGDWGTANPVKESFGAKASDAYPYQTVCWPASSPSVTAVGGTWLQYHWRWNPQTNWTAFLAYGVDLPAEDPVAMAFLNWDATEDRVETVWREDWTVVHSGAGQAADGGLSTVSRPRPGRPGCHRV